MDQNPKQVIVEKLKSAANVLVTVSNSPNVDQLSAALGLTLMLNALDGHAITVFSGKIPNALEFLEPEKSIDSTVNSLRDFIISIDKEKADKLRYKVEDNVVRIFITPYRTTLSQDDLSFSQGDFNVDVVVALGVSNKKDLDQAISTHGRILHDASIVSITAGGEGEGDLGAVNWHDPTASSLSEMLVSMSEALKSGILDKAMSTAFLTGIVSATERFSNDKTSPKVMTMSAQLMAAGADQQLISKNLRMDRGRTAPPVEMPPPVDKSNLPEAAKDPSVLKVHGSGGELDELSLDEIEGKHGDSKKSVEKNDKGEEELQETRVTDERQIIKDKKREDELADGDGDGPALGGVFNATSKSAHDDAVAARNDGMNREILNHTPEGDVAEDIEFTEVAKSDDDKPSAPEEPAAQTTPKEDPEVSAKVDHNPTEELDEARNAVEAAMDFTPDHNPTASVGAQPMEMVGTDAQLDTQIQIDANGQILPVGSEPLSESAAPDMAAAPSLPPLVPDLEAPTQPTPPSTISAIPPPEVVDESVGASLEPTAPDQPLPSHETVTVPPPHAAPPLPPKPESVLPEAPPPPPPPKPETGGHEYMAEPPGVDGASDQPENPLFTQQL